jgi:hypothetical protein
MELNGYFKPIRQFPSEAFILRMVINGLWHPTVNRQKKEVAN